MYQWYQHIPVSESNMAVLSLAYVRVERRLLIRFPIAY